MPTPKRSENRVSREIKTALPRVPETETADARPMSPVEVAMAALASYQEDVWTSVLALENRLAPVLHSGAPGSESGKDQPTSAYPLAAAIYEQADFAERTDRRLRDILSALGV